MTITFDRELSFPQYQKKSASLEGKCIIKYTDVQVLFVSV